jgi:hypothetical protein
MTERRASIVLALAVTLAAGCTLYPSVETIPGLLEFDRTIVLNEHGQSLHFAIPPGPPRGPLLIYATGDAGWRFKDLALYHAIVSWGRPVAGFSAREYVTHFGTDTTTPERLGRDYLAIITMARAELHLPPHHPVILVGVSRGAGLSVVAAGERAVRDQLSGVLAIALTREEEYVHGRRLTPDARVLLDPEETSMVQVYEYLPRLGLLPISIVQSTHDEYLPANEARALFGPDTDQRRLDAVAARDHNFSDARQVMYVAAHDALTWIEQRLPR